MPNTIYHKGHSWNAPSR